MLLQKLTVLIATCSVLVSTRLCEAGEETAQVGDIVLENEYVKYLIGADGRNLSFVDKRTGKDYCAKEPAHYCVQLKKGGKNYPPSALSYADGQITARFGESAVTAVIKVIVKKHYFVFELVSINDKDEQVSEFVLSDLHLTIAGHVGHQSRVIRDDRFAVCLRSLNLRVVRVLLYGPTLRSACTRRIGLVGAKIAVVGCPVAEVRSVLRELLKAEGLPCSPVGGPWALDSDLARGSYLFCRPSEADVDQWIRLAKLAGMRQMMFVGCFRYGDYEPNRSLYPHGLAGVKAVIDKIHAAGMLAGLHMHSSGISKHTPWVRPVPDPGLFKDAHFTLAARVSRDAKVIPTVEVPRGDTYGGYTSRGNDIQIDDEIIRYTGLSTQQPYAFTGCIRGANGTKAAGHDKGTVVSHLAQMYGFYLPDPHSRLFDKLTQSIADAYNTCGFDMIYFDGLGAESVYGPRGEGSYHMSRMVLTTLAKFKRSVGVEGAAYTHHMWPIHSKLGALDYPHHAIKRWIDYHCDHGRGVRERELLPYQLGWWALLGPGPTHDATTHDQVDYMCCKSLGNDMSFSFQGISVTDLPADAELQEIGGDVVTAHGEKVDSASGKLRLLTLMGRYERLRLSGAVPESIKARLRAPGDEFRLRKTDDGTWQFIPTNYLSHKVTGLDNGTSTWKVSNRFGAQPLKLKIEALLSAGSYDAPDNIVLADFGKDDEFTVRTTAKGATHKLARCADVIQSRKAAACYTAKNTGKNPRGAWAHMGKTFSRPLDLTDHRVVGVWIHGDGKGELLNVQLWNPYGPTFRAYEEQYINIDFVGWRYFELFVLERDVARYFDYKWPYRFSRWYIEMGRVRPRNQMINLSLYYNELPPDQEVRCYLSQIKALPTAKVKLRNPSVTIGGKKIVFPVALESRCYIEFNSLADCKLYDERGALVQQVQPRGEVPRLAAGDNQLKFACEGPEGFSARAKVTVITCGKPLQETAASGSN